MKKLHNPSQVVPEFYVVIPARHASTRLPGKPLLDIAGKPMVVWVAERALVSGAKQVIVATDDLRIVDAVNQHGHAAVMTKADHVSGTDRIAEVASIKGWSDDAIIVNVQGDEPLIDAKLIVEVAFALSANNEAVMATACHAIHDKSDFINPNVVKVVMDVNGNAMYFSRAPIPFPRDTYTSQDTLAVGIPAYRHIGIYAYRAGFLKQYANLAPAAIEQYESLEQLRVLYEGYKIAVTVSDNAPAAGVDTESDLTRVRTLMASK
ncbi:3-deoxy-manno-octulosonate cytidylyltransferase [Methylotenera sp. L2L1]|uniref:3-deoxy-manno-octulosonate cytidylyltransferase n=1 Tax=Methylotenera sp. L2L1 TaxID=1502770 RepID=UPI0006918113|nr:3-deoxy-manno-octulosonate cytidylyltransferase [Methylotenera sp. L2L1]